MSKRRSRVPAMHRPRTPSWRVMLVGFGFCEEPNCTIDHDDEDPAEAFGYTVGLYEGHRLPELHLWAQAEDNSVEPLDYATAGRVLNMLGRGVASREFKPGDGVMIHGVTGYGDLSFHLGEPVDPEDVDAYQAAEDAKVIPVDWVPRSSIESHTHARSLTIGAREGGKIVFISYSDDKVADNDTGFILEYEGAPELWEYTEDTFGVLCTHCLINDHPEVAAGLELARQWGAAELVDGKWVARGEDE